MGYSLKWGNGTWLYALALGLGIGMAVLLLFWKMMGQFTFWNYYSPMLGYYVLVSICQSHYFKSRPEPNMGGLFRQFVSIFGAILIFFVNEMIMLYLMGVPETPSPVLIHGGIVTAGHFTFIVFGFFIYGVDDFMFKGKLVRWIGNDTLKALFWYVVIWLLWVLLFYMKGGVAQAYSTSHFDPMGLDRMLGISQWAIIVSLLYALVFRDWLPELQSKMRIRNDILFGLVLLVASLVIGAAVAYMLYFSIPYITPWGDPGSLSATEKWHHVLYMGTYPLTPAVLLGVYSTSFATTRGAGTRVLKRLAVVIAAVILSYYVFHLIIAQPELLINGIAPGSVKDGMGLFAHDGGWFDQLDLYFNFTVSIIPLTHHWFCGSYGFMKKTKFDSC